MTGAFRILSTKLGAVGIVAGERGLRRVYLPERTVGGLRQRIRREFPNAAEQATLEGIDDGTNGMWILRQNDTAASLNLQTFA